MNIPNFTKETSRPIDFAGASSLEATHEAKRGPWVCTKSLQIQAMIHPKDTPPWIHRTVQPEGKNTYKVGFNAAVFNPWMCILCVGISCFFCIHVDELKSFFLNNMVDRSKNFRFPTDTSHDFQQLMIEKRYGRKKMWRWRRMPRSSSRKSVLRAHCGPLSGVGGGDDGGELLLFPY